MRTVGSGEKDRITGPRKQATINSQLESVANHVEAGEWADARTLIAVVTERKLNTAQRAELDALSAAVPAAGKPTQSSQLAKYRVN